MLNDESRKEYEEWFAASVQEGIAEADSGEVIDHDRVKSWVDSWDTGNELDRPE
jgi:predicted transcriptional regulator